MHSPDIVLLELVCVCVCVFASWGEGLYKQKQVHRLRAVGLWSEHPDSHLSSDLLGAWGCSLNGLNLNLPISKVETIIIIMQFLQGLKETGCVEVLSTVLVFCKVPFSPSRHRFPCAWLRL